jgi:hypothetical protein
MCTEILVALRYAIRYRKDASVVSYPQKLLQILILEYYIYGDVSCTHAVQ